ncbi:hypothetical protein EVAR_20673_1 [Eumeta japonica]|uniref:Uncharacterized protein n=1 Tax=Eumeta variegata TaxID=151549 RepID=A0A4C1V9P4_EUMVA|nr:hypothetical protein EVAR_20673_1 [Eumeta japonica]
MKARKHQTRSLDAPFLEVAKRAWMRRAQVDSFVKEIQVLRNGHILSRKSKLWKLDLIWENGLLRVRSRISAVHVPATAKQPMILDGKHSFTRLLVQHEHKLATSLMKEWSMNSDKDTR